LWLTDSMRRRRRVIVLVADGPEEFERWAFWLRRASEAVLERHYEMSAYINTGSFARVVRGRDLHSGTEVAIKLIEKSNTPPSARRYMAREVAIMRRVRHANVVRCLDVFDTKLRTRIVMELCPGVLQDVIEARGGRPLPEADAREILRDVLMGLRYLHGLGIVHRDVKPGNILLSAREPPYGPAKLSDFGLSNYVGDGGDGFGDEWKGELERNGDGEAVSEKDGTQVLSSAVGTMAFVAPDLLLGENYGAAVDMWSAGVVLYVMLAGGPLPFRGSTSSAVLSALKHGAVDMAALPASAASGGARGMLLALLNVDPAARLTPEEALDHPWMKSCVPSRGDGQRALSRSADGAEGVPDARGRPATTTTAMEMPAAQSRSRRDASAVHGVRRRPKGAAGAGAAPAQQTLAVSSGGAGEQDWSMEAFVRSTSASSGHVLVSL
jgi:serine/threonine protein kinase